MTAPNAHPLQWPAGRPRTQRRERARFKVTFAAARDGVIEQIRLLGGRLPVISSNVALRRGGLPYANQPEPDDPGVAVYFEHEGRQVCFSCDRWDRVRDNLRAIEKTIEAMRGIERWGTGDMVSAAFTGFEALPPPDAGDPVPLWPLVLGLTPGRSYTADEVRAAYREAVKRAHPDAGGTPEHFARVQRAWEQAQKELAS